MNSKLYRIENVAQKTGLTKRALRYYEEMELVTPIRTEAGYRLYSEEDITEILRIKQFRESLGFNLNSVKYILDLKKNLNDLLETENCDKEKLESSIQEVKNQIELIEEKENALENMKSKYIDILRKLQSK